MCFSVLYAGPQSVPCKAAIIQMGHTESDRLEESKDTVAGKCGELFQKGESKKREVQTLTKPLLTLELHLCRAAQQTRRTGQRFLLLLTVEGMTGFAVESSQNNCLL